MEYKKSEPIHGKLDGRYTTFYQYEFPRATRNKGKFLPQGTVRLREYLYCDGGHGQLIQIILLSPSELVKGNEQRVLVDKMLDINREDKKFREGTLVSQELSGDIREYTGKKLISLSKILSEQEKIGLFASASRVKDSRRRQRRAKQWKIRIQIALVSALFVLGVVSGGFLQKSNFFDLEENSFYQDYVVVFIDKVADIIHLLFR
ncbi:MAG: hypothetical protein QNK27_05700 [Desulfuromusa sp.]|nr:hypothetical protein [Desulfuromusa sp.]